MVTSNLRVLFWDTDPDTFLSADHPDYTILRVLEFGDDVSVSWLRQTFPEDEIRRVLSTERRLSEKSATFWALVYSIPPSKIAALNDTR